MANYTSKNTKVLETYDDNGNLRMLLAHECDSGRVEYIVGSYFSVRAALVGGLADEEGRLYDHETGIEIKDDFIESGRLDSEAWRLSWPHLVKEYSWDWGHYFQDIVSAVDYWKSEVLFGAVERYEIHDWSEFADLEGCFLEVTFNNDNWCAQMVGKDGERGTYRTRGFLTKSRLLDAFRKRRPTCQLEYRETIRK